MLICSIEFVTTNSMFKNIHGRIFLNAPPLYFQLSPCSYTVSLQKAYGKVFQNGQGCPWCESATSLDVRLNSQVKNIQGCIFFTVPAVNLCLRLVSVPSLFKRLAERGLLKIYDASTASYAENKCSTYQRYACALFSASSLYLHRLFPKALARVSVPSLFKRLTERISGRTGMSVVPRSNKFV